MSEVLAANVCSEMRGIAKGGFDSLREEILVELDKTQWLALPVY